MKRMILGVGVVMMGLLLVAGLASAEIPHLINFQGRLTDTSGAPVPDSNNYKIIFSIYRTPDEVVALWSETHPAVSVKNGIFSVTLGKETEGGIPSTVFEEKDRYLGIKVGTDPEMTPRQRITSVGYAFNADRVKGSNIFPSSGNVGIGTITPGTMRDAPTLTTTFQVYNPNASIYTSLATGSGGEAMQSVENANRQYRFGIQSNGSWILYDDTADAVRFRVNTNGIVDLPGQSRVTACISSGGQTFSQGVPTVVQFGSVKYDAQSEYSTSTHRFTAKEAGVYSVKSTITISPTEGNKYFWLRIYKNDVQWTGNVCINRGIGISESFSVWGDVPLAAGDYITISVYSGSSGVFTVAPYAEATILSIHKIA